MNQAPNKMMRPAQETKTCPACKGAKTVVKDQYGNRETCRACLGKGVTSTGYQTK